MTRRRAVAILCALAALASPASAEGLGRVFPKDMLAYAEARPAELVLAAEEWELDQSGLLDGPLRRLARACGMTIEDLRPELRKVKSAAVGVVRIDPGTEKFVFLAAVDLGESAALREALERRIESLPKGSAVVAQNVLIVGSDPAEVKSALARLDAPGGEGFDQSAWYRSVALDAARDAARAMVDVARVRRWLREAEPNNDDFAALEALFDLKTVDRIDAAAFRAKGSLALNARIRFLGNNRTFAALRTVPAAGDATRFFSVDWGLVHYGALRDGASQARMLKQVVAEHAAIDGERRPLRWIAQAERILGAKIEDAAADVTEYAVGVRARGDGGPGREVLVALKLKDAARAEALAKRAQEATGANGRWTWASSGAFLLAGSSEKAVADGLATFKGGRSILDERTAKEALANLAADRTKIALVNPLGLMPAMARNPYAPPPSLLAAAVLETDRSVEITVDLSQTQGLVANLARLFGAK